MDFAVGLASAVSDLFLIARVGVVAVAIITIPVTVFMVALFIAGSVVNHLRIAACAAPAVGLIIIAGLNLAGGLAGSITHIILVAFFSFVAVAVVAIPSTVLMIASLLASSISNHFWSAVSVTPAVLFVHIALFYIAHFLALSVALLILPALFGCVAVAI